MDRRRFNGGNKNAGRKPKANEIKLIETLDLNINQTLVFEKLKELIEDGSIRAIEVYLKLSFWQAQGKSRNEFKTGSA